MKPKKPKEYRAELQIFFRAESDKEAQREAKRLAIVNTGMGIEAEIINVKEMK
jgi:hypothetical protein